MLWLGSDDRLVNCYSPLLALVVDSLPAYKIDDTFELIFDADGNLHGGSGYAKLIPNLFNNTPRICPWSGYNLRFPVCATVLERTCPFC